jgi:ABC-type arginine/histidine transport system permease subunit
MTACCTSELRKVKRLRLVALDGVAVALEVERGPPREVILVLRLLRLVLVIAVVDCVGMAHIVDANDERFHAGERLLALEGERAQHQADDARTRIVTFK